MPPTNLSFLAQVVSNSEKKSTHIHRTNHQLLNISCKIYFNLINFELNLNEAKYFLLNCIVCSCFEWQKKIHFH